jgi:hypothetical protein
MVGIDKTGLGHLAVGLVATLLRPEAQIRHRAALAGNPIVMCAVQACILVEVVRVICADLRGFVRWREEAGEIRVREFHMHFKRNPQEPAQITKALRAGQRVAGRLRPENLLAAAF